MTSTPLVDSAATFDRRFLAAYAIYATTLGMLYIFMVTFVPIPKENAQFAGPILGFILGTLLTAPLAFFYGASKAQPPAPPAAPAVAQVTANTALAAASPAGTPGDPVNVQEVKP